MKKFYLIGNSHIDPVWLWRWQDGYSEVLATYRSALDRMREYDDFKYTSACAVYYQWVEKTDPEMFAEIVERVKEGRWSIAGGWFLQPDCNIPCGESLARHALVSQRYFKDRFGVTAKTGYNVDSFGHNASMPKILRGCGLENYVFMRPGQHEKALEFDVFDWVADDGSRVRAHRIHALYGVTSQTVHFLDESLEKIKSDGIPRMGFYGVGNHGGGPTVELINTIKEKNYPDSVFGTVDEYFDSIRSLPLPALSGELQHHARGCYSAMSYVKQMNRLCEENILASERLSLLANRLSGYKYPAKKLNKAWKNLLFNQFHDILAGCSIESAYKDASYLYGEIMSITEQIINGAMQSVCRTIRTGDDSAGAYKTTKNWLVWEHERLGTPIVVFNSQPFPVRDNIKMNISTTAMTDNEGNPIPIQRVRGEQTNVEDDNTVVIFPVDLPAYGYRVYRAYQGKAAENNFEEVSATESSLENGFLRVEFDKKTGEISRIADKISGKIITEGGFSTLFTDESECDTWAHNKFDLGKVCDNFTLSSIEIIEKGAVCATLRVTVECGSSSVSRDYTLFANSDRVQVDCTVEMHERHKALKFGFPAKDSVICEIPFGTVERKLENGEEPFGKWFASGDLCVANDSKYGYDSTSDQIRMTVLRSAVYADHYGKRVCGCRYMDQGEHRFSYSLFAYNGAADAHRKAAALNFAPRAVNASFHGGTLPEISTNFSCDSKNITVTAIKMSEDSNSAIIRCFESMGAAAEAEISLFNSSIHTSLSHNSIATVDELGSELNFIEWNEEK